MLRLEGKEHIDKYSDNLVIKWLVDSQKMIYNIIARSIEKNKSKHWATRLGAFFMPS